MTPARNMKVMPPYFLIKISKEAQAQRREKEGSLYLPQNYIYMRRELQFGIIEQIGSTAHEYFTEAEVGDYLFIHHMATGKKDDKGYNFFLMDEDDEFNYYVINAFEFNGDRNLSYAVAKGSEIIPNKDYIFLELEKDVSEMYVLESGLTIVPERKKTRAEWAEVMKKNMERCKQLARNLPQNPLHEKIILANPRFRELMNYSYSEIKKLEAENVKISKQINKKKFELFKAAYINPEWNEAIEKSLGKKIEPGDLIYMLNLACHTEIDIFGKTLIVAETKYFAASLSYMKKIVNDFNAATHNNTSAEKGTNTRRNKQAKN